jgi:pimeloyl-ACP methyl ester carboxylesterase
VPTRAEKGARAFRERLAGRGGTAHGTRWLVLAAAIGLLAGCSSPPPTTAGSSSSSIASSSIASGSTSSSTTTTTTLPAEEVVGGTAPTGSLSYLGSVMRVEVEPLAEGQIDAVAGGPETGPAPVTIAFRQLGSGPDLLMVMGQSGSMSWWEPTLLQSLSQSFHVTVFDLPGIGYSGPDPAGGSPSIDRYADVTAGLVDALGLHHPVVVGWGMGGEVALEVALRHAGLASKLVLVDTSAGGRSASSTKPDVARVLGAPSSTLTRLAQLLFSPADTGDRAAWLLAMLQEGPDDVVASGIEAEAGAQAGWWRSGASVASLGTVSVPAMVVWGSNDVLFSRGDASSLANALPVSRLVVLEGAGYASLFEDDSLFASDLESFVSS